MSADVSCRVAWADDAASIAGVQVRAWRTSYADLLPTELLEALDVEEIAAGWRQSLSTAPGRPQPRAGRARAQPGHRVRLTGPATDPDCDPVADGEITDLTIDPHKRHAGHGSRLMQAGIDTLKADRFSRAVIWLPARDDETRAFLTAAGWAPDGAHRTLDLTGDGSVQVKQVRLHTAVAT